MLEAFRLGPAHAGYWDADLSTPLEAILELRQHLNSNAEVEMVFGARVRLMGRRVVRRAVRHYLGRVFATAASVVLGIGIYDTQCGAKIFRVSHSIDWLFQRPFSFRWIFDVEILARFLPDFRASGQGSPDDAIHETPLLRQDAPGSKVKPVDFPKAFYELWRIHRIWLSKNASPRRAAFERVGGVAAAPAEDAVLVAKGRV